MWRKLWFTEKIEQVIRRLIARGVVKIQPGTGLCVPTSDAMDYNTNWLFCGNTVASRDCFLWHEIMFNHFNLVPRFCRFNCYKVVIKPRNFLEAYQFYNLLAASAVINADICGIHGKCGIDSRYYTDNPFNGFVYCDGPKDAQEKYEIVRKLVDENIEDGENIPVIVKRSCTEFEKLYGPTDNAFWQNMSEEDEDLQKRLEDIFVGFWMPSVQPDWLKNKIILAWIKWANTHGDKTWVDVFGEDFLTMSAVTYHKNPEETSE